MKGKREFTAEEIAKLQELIKERQKASSNKQKSIRDRMRKIGFYGRDDWGIHDCQLPDLEELIKSGRIKIVDSKIGTPPTLNQREETSTNTRCIDQKSKNISERDEDYVIDLCDIILKQKASRQHRFDFLCGDTGCKLPVDAYYKDLHLVVEYYEKQHTESVKIFDKKMTASGVLRDEQRRIYDERRKIVLPQHGINVIIISYSDFKFDKNKKIIRNEEDDLRVIRLKLKECLK